MTHPRPELSELLRCRFPDALVSPISGDASTRAFFRVREPRDCFVIMDYGAPFRGETDDVRLSRIFAQAQLPVARVVSVEPEAGCLVLEDLGERTMQSVLEALEEPGQVRDLYRRAVELAAAVALKGTPVLARSERAGGPALDEERFRFEMDFFLEHYVRGLCRLEAAAPALRAELELLAARASNQSPRVFCHRDFHSRNIMVREDGTLAMVDIQDARWGPDAYDLASLLYDAYVDIPHAIVEEMLEVYRAACQDPEPLHVFRRRFGWIAAQRMIKALGTFGFQTVVRRNPHYLTAIPRTLERLRLLLPRVQETQRLDLLFREYGLFVPRSAGDSVEKE